MIIKKIAILSMATLFAMFTIGIWTPTWAALTGDEIDLVNDNDPTPGSGGSSGDSNKGGKNSGSPTNIKPEFITEVSEVLDSTKSHTGNYGKNYIKDNYYKWTFSNTTTGNSTSDKTSGNKYTWIPKETGKYKIMSEVNCKYQYYHEQYYTETVFYSRLYNGDGYRNYVLDAHTYAQITSETIYDYKKDEFDSERTKTWNFTVTADMLDKPIPVPPPGPDVEIPCDYELTL